MPHVPPDPDLHARIEFFWVSGRDETSPGFSALGRYTECETRPGMERAQLKATSYSGAASGPARARLLDSAVHIVHERGENGEGLGVGSSPSLISPTHSLKYSPSTVICTGCSRECFPPYFGWTKCYQLIALWRKFGLVVSIPCWYS